MTERRDFIKTVGVASATVIGLDIAKKLGFDVSQIILDTGRGLDEKLDIFPTNEKLMVLLTDNEYTKLIETIKYEPTVKRKGVNEAPNDKGFYVEEAGVITTGYISSDKSRLTIASTLKEDTGVSYSLEENEIVAQSTNSDEPTTAIDSLILSARRIGAETIIVKIDEGWVDMVSEVNQKTYQVQSMANLRAISIKRGSRLEEEMERINILGIKDFILATTENGYKVMLGSCKKGSIAKYERAITKINRKDVMEFNY